MLKRLVILVAIAFTAIAGFSSPAFAQIGQWRLAARTGFVRVVQPNQPAHDGAVNEVIAPGSIITTGASSSATLENGAQRMVMQPSSRMTIARTTDTNMTRIIQDLGAVLFRVDHRDVQHFRVETPLLAATVKGTEFRVTVRPLLDSVAVQSGIVEVRANNGGALQDVRRGASVHIAGSAPMQIAAGLGEQIDVWDAPNATALQGSGSGLRGTDGAAFRPTETYQPNQTSGSVVLESMPKLPTTSGRINGTFLTFVALYFVGAFAVGFLFYVGVRLVTGRAGVGKHKNQARAPAQPPAEPQPQPLDTKKQSSLRAFVQDRAARKKA